MNELTPAENMAFTVAMRMIERDENPGINVTTALVITIQRLLAAGDE